MNYTKTIRQFCMQNDGMMFDAAKMAEYYFPMVPYKTLLKILNRLRDEGLLTPVSKGVYQIVVNEKTDRDEAIKNTYIENYRGMYVGYRMYNEIGISSYNNGSIEIYTSNITTKHKNIGHYKLTRADIFFVRKIKNIICALELIENIANIKDIDYIRYYEERQSLINSYNDMDFKEIIKEITYQYATIVTLEMLVKENTSEICNCIDIYREFYLKNEKVLF